MRREAVGDEFEVLREKLLLVLARALGYADVPEDLGEVEIEVGEDPLLRVDEEVEELVEKFLVQEEEGQLREEALESFDGFDADLRSDIPVPRKDCLLDCGPEKIDEGSGENLSLFQDLLVLRGDKEFEGEVVGGGLLEDGFRELEGGKSDGAQLAE